MVAEQALDIRMLMASSRLPVPEYCSILCVLKPDSFYGECDELPGRFQHDQQEIPALRTEAGFP